MNPETLQYLEEKLQRPPSALQLKDGTFLAEFFSFGAPASKFVGATEGEALERLADYLRSRDTGAGINLALEEKSDEQNE